MGMYLPYVPVFLKVPKVRTVKMKMRLSQKTERRIPVPVAKKTVLRMTKKSMVKKTGKGRRGADLGRRTGEDEVNAHIDIRNNYKELLRFAWRNTVGLKGGGWLSNQYRSYSMVPTKQCSGSVGSVTFWDSRIRYYFHESGSGAGSGSFNILPISKQSFDEFFPSFFFNNRL
jgi:hypothetical protein